MSNELTEQDMMAAGTQYIMGSDMNLENIVSVVTQIDNKGIAILFTFIDDETSVVEASITDNFVETNHAVQDHIAIKPRIYRLRGCVGEVIYSASNEWSKWISDQVDNHPILQKTLNYMQPIASVSGVVSSATQSAINIVNQLESSYNRYKKMLDDFLNPNQNKLLNRRQELTVADLNRILELRIPVNLKGLKFETTFTAGDDYERKYYLQSVSAHQGSNNFISDIEITIKEFRIATTKLTSPDPQKYGKLDVSATQKANSGSGNTGAATMQNPSENAKDKISKVLQSTKDKINSSAAGQAANKVIQKVNNAVKVQNVPIKDTRIGQMSSAVKVQNVAFKDTPLGKTIGRYFNR